mmetsp:Transcript_22589/g.48903  ORF Transcript_22589/g.48903 Transcript_22589/m.48903 type:complete len:205 (+) Transcript_22589:540-1154(+)
MTMIYWVMHKRMRMRLPSLPGQSLHPKLLILHITMPWKLLQMWSPPNLSDNIISWRGNITQIELERTMRKPLINLRILLKHTRFSPILNYVLNMMKKGKMDCLRIERVLPMRPTKPIRPFYSPSCSEVISLVTMWEGLPWRRVPWSQILPRLDQRRHELCSRGESLDWRLSWLRDSMFGRKKIMMEQRRYGNQQRQIWASRVMV